MKSRKRILIFIDWFFPGYKAGGPIQSVVNLIHHLGDEYDFYVVTSNKDLGETEGYSGVSYNSWIQKEKYQVIYLDETQQNLKKYKELFRERNYDSIYLNSLFSVNFTLKPLLLATRFEVKIVLAPRGMLGKGALDIKRKKKQLFLKLFKLSQLSRRITWHATADTEVQEVKQHFGSRAKVHLATNLSAVMTEAPVLKKKDINSFNLFFLSRISQKKNLKAALEYILEVSTDYIIQFTIIGPIEEADYWKECEAIIQRLPENVKVTFVGAIPNYLIKETLKDQHFMLLPTFHENFGHVIMESWQNACPVIISNNTPWQGLEEKKIGFNLDLGKPQDFVEAIERAAEMDQEEFNKCSQAAFNFAKDYCANPEAVEAYRRLFA